MGTALWVTFWGWPCRGQKRKDLVRRRSLAHGYPPNRLKPAQYLDLQGRIWLQSTRNGPSATARWKVKANRQPPYAHVSGLVDVVNGAGQCHCESGCSQ